MQIEVADIAEYQVGEKEVYEQMHLDHDLFCNRLISLIESQNFIGSGPKFKLVRDPGRENDRGISKINLSGTFSDVEQTERATLLARINFSVIDECVDTSILW